LLCNKLSLDIHSSQCVAFSESSSAFNRKDEGSGTGMQSYARTSVKQDRPFTEKTIEPSYQMRFLQHNGQVVTGTKKKNLSGVKRNF